MTTSDEARAILAEARETLEQTADIEVGHRSHGPDALQSWRRGMPKPESSSHNENIQRRKLTDAESLRISKQWQAYIDDRIAATLEPLRAAIGVVVAQERQAHGAEIEKLDLRLSALLAEVTKRQTIAEAAGEVIDLPALHLRGRSG
jgi:hypothetical protein